MKKGKALCLLAMSAVLLTGCVDSMPELTKEQSGLIAEYAASLLLKYSPNYNYKIVSEEELAAAKAAEQEQAESQTGEEIAAAEPQTENEMVLPEEQQVSDEFPMEAGEAETDIETELVTADINIAAEIGIEDITIKYKSYELCDSYPQNNSGFSVSAAQGKKLLVIHFELQGSLIKDVDCNLFDYNIKMRTNVNDNSNTALSTMLPNELMSYMDTIKAAEPEDVVAVVEMDDISEDEISSFILEVSSDGGNCTIRLK